MSERPTPQQRKRAILDIAAEVGEDASPLMQGRLAAIEDWLDECVIVHPEDEQAVFSLAVQAGIIVRRGQP